MRTDFNPEIWGPHTWFFIETVVMSYPKNPSQKEKLNIKNFFDILEFILPCTKCRINYGKHKKENPLNSQVLSSRENLFKWVVDLHNKSYTTKKKSYEDTINFYLNQFESKEHFFAKTNNKLKLIVFFVIIVTIIIFILYKLKII